MLVFNNFKILLGLRSNIVCGLAIGRSLAEEGTVINIRPKDSPSY